MVPLDTCLMFVLIIGLCCGSNSSEQPPQCSIENARFLPIYDLKSTSLNVMKYDDILEAVLGSKFYQFDDVEKHTVGGMFYGSYPVLAVYQPDKNIPELHGYYYPMPWGLEQTYDRNLVSSEIFAKYRTFRDFLNSIGDKEGYTPVAALHMYPKLKNYKLTKIIDNSEKQSPVLDCAVLFVFPKEDSRKSNKFEQIYQVFEEYYYNNTELCRARDLEAADDSYDYDGYATLLTVFVPKAGTFILLGHKQNGDRNERNLIDRDHFNEYFSGDGYYQFEKFDAGFTNYSQNPTLIVIQPYEKIPELHGFFFNGGIESLTSYLPDPEGDVFFHDYKPFFEYILLKETFLDGLTPDAARYDYPYILDFKLTKFIFVEDLPERFAVLFLAPLRHRPLNFKENYYAMASYGIDDS